MYRRCFAPVIRRRSSPGLAPLAVDWQREARRLRVAEQAGPGSRVPAHRRGRGLYPSGAARRRDVASAVAARLRPRQRERPSGRPGHLPRPGRGPRPAGSSRRTTGPAPPPGRSTARTAASAGSPARSTPGQGQQVTLYVSTTGPGSAPRPSAWATTRARAPAWSGVGRRSPAPTSPPARSRRGVNMVACDNWSPSLTFTRHPGVRPGRLPDQADRPGEPAELRAADGLGPGQHRHLRDQERRVHLAGLELLRRLRLLPGPGQLPAGRVPHLQPGPGRLLRPALRRRERLGQLPRPGVPAGQVGRTARPRRHLHHRPDRPGAPRLPAQPPGPAVPRPRRVLVAGRTPGRRHRLRPRRQHRLLRRQPRAAARPHPAVAVRRRPRAHRLPRLGRRPARREGQPAAGHRQRVVEPAVQLARVRLRRRHLRRLPRARPARRLPVADASAWVFAGTGLRDGQVIPDVVASDVDKFTRRYGQPADDQILGHSPIPAPGPDQHRRRSSPT